MAVADPTLRTEGALKREGARFVIGCDEVGRGAIAGPVAVGLSLIDTKIRRFPPGLRDSKMLSEKRREELAPVAASWSLFSSVGLASAFEVDSIGIIAALGRAGARALQLLREASAPLEEAVILLDGSHDWLTLYAQDAPPVRTRIKADRDCASVAAASVIAKVHRDRIMIAAAETTPGYAWAANKGYASKAHFDALDILGPSVWHRHTWLRDRDAPALFELG